MDRHVIVDLLARQIRLQEARAGRSAVGACVALPPSANGPETAKLIQRAVRPDGPRIEIEVLEANGNARVLTVDFTVQDGR